MSGLVLSIFPGIDLLGRAFEAEGFCVVRGPDPIFGGDIRTFHPPSGVFAGIVGGPPCQSFSNLAALNRHLGREPRHGNLIPEYERVVAEAQPRWWLMENVPTAPLPWVEGYETCTIRLDNRWLGADQRRMRRFTFGTHDGRHLDLSPDVVLLESPTFELAVTSSGGGLAGMRYDRGGTTRPTATVERALAAAKRPISEMLTLQGLPSDLLDEAPFTSDGKREVIANGVPIPMGRALARAINRALEVPA